MNLRAPQFGGRAWRPSEHEFVGLAYRSDGRDAPEPLLYG
jgi:hypothetical protein